MKVGFLGGLVLMMMPFAAPLAAQSPGAQPVMTEIQSAYGRADFAALGPHLAERIAFDGEVEVIADQAGGDIVMHDPTAVRREPAGIGAGGMAATIAGPSLVTSYERLVMKIGRDRLVQVLRDLSWRQVRTDRDGYPYREARAGDWVLYTHFRSDEGPDVLDEVVMFVLREQPTGYRVVAHFADF